VVNGSQQARPFWRVLYNKDAGDGIGFGYLPHDHRTSWGTPHGVLWWQERRGLPICFTYHGAIAPVGRKRL